jgi:hypothetical protein
MLSLTYGNYKHLFCHVCEREILVGRPVYRAHDKSFCSELCRDDLLQEFHWGQIVFHTIFEET